MLQRLSTHAWLERFLKDRMTDCINLHHSGMHQNQQICLPWCLHQKPPMFPLDLSSLPIGDRICDLVEHTQFLHPAKKIYIYMHQVNDRGKKWQVGVGCLWNMYFKKHPVTVELLPSTRFFLVFSTLLQKFRTVWVYLECPNQVSLTDKIPPCKNLQTL